MKGTRIPAFRILLMLASLESPRTEIPFLTMTSATRGSPQTPLVTPVIVKPLAP